MKATVTEIGAQALAGKEPIIILFGENATESLKEHSVIQQIEGKKPLEMQKGDKLKIGKDEYIIEFVGPFANSNLNSISHVTLVFNEVPKEDAIANGLYLSPSKRPEIEIGTIIEYVSHGA